MKKEIVIIGGVAGGASAAARLRRLNEECNITIFERGTYISYANCGLPYYIGDVITNRNALLLQTPERMRERFRVNVFVNHNVLEIQPEVKQIKVHDEQNDKIFLKKYDTLIIATGSSPITPRLAGSTSERIFQVWTVSDVDRIKAFAAANELKRSVVIGGGFIGLEMAENLHALGLETTIVEMSNQVMAPLDYEMATVLHNSMRKSGIHLVLGDGVKAFREDNGLVVELSGGNRLETDIAILAIGVRPNGELARKAGIKTNERGGIVVNRSFHTSVENIYAVGDVAEICDYIDQSPTMIPLAGPANKQGRMVANILAGIKEEYDGSMGTSIARVFDYAAASTGHNEKRLMRDGLVRGRDYETVTIMQMSHAGYYPGATQMFLKLLFEIKTGRVLGAQIVGHEGVDKRIDTIATTIHFNGTVDDLASLELAYAPPFSSAKDPVNMLGFVAQNVRQNLAKIALWDAPDKADEHTILLDVRKPEECAKSPIPGTVNIPLDDLRNRLTELHNERNIIVFCAIGVRAHIASCILKNNGFADVSIYPGGASFYNATH